MDKLSKVSVPSWDKEFATEAEACAELLSHICGDCLGGVHHYVGAPTERVPAGSEYEYDAEKPFLTLYAVRHGRDKALALVIAKDGADAVQVCIEDGLEWAKLQTQVTRIHRRMYEDRGLIDLLETAGGSGNTKNVTRQFIAGAQVQGHKAI